MKKRLRSIYWLTMLVALIAAVSAITMMVKMKVDDTRDNLRSILQAASAWTLESTEDLKSLAGEIASVSPPLRVTFMMDHGLVLADSEEDVFGMESHIEREEIREAIRGGIGESMRVSYTQMTITLYAAKQIAPQLILRLSYPLAETTRILAIYIGALIALFVLLHNLQSRAIRRLAEDMARQMDDVRALLEKSTGRVEAVFPELQPALDNIAYLAHRLGEDMQKVLKTQNLREDFVANASHELRSPLTSVMGFAEMLGEGMAETEEEQKVCIDMIRGECQRMLHVIEDILLLSKAEKLSAGDIKELDLRAAAQEVCDALAPQAQQKRISLSIEGDLRAEASDQDMWEILYNLIGNAVQYGREGGHVQIALGAGRIAISDDGIGIQPEHLPHIFEQFYRVDEARDASAKGTGLGLSIVRALVERNDAQIRVESEHGRGSCFTIDFSGR